MRNGQATGFSVPHTSSTANAVWWMCLISPFKNHVLDLAGAVSERCLGWGGRLGKTVSALVLPPVCTLWNTTFTTHFKDWSPPMEALDVRPEAAWTCQATGCPNGWVAVLIFVMNLFVNILGENGNRQEIEGNWPFSSQRIVYILVKL